MDGSQAFSATPFAGVQVACLNVSMVYEVDGDPMVALDDVTFTVDARDEVAVIGPSGSGKSTLTTLLAGLRRPTAGGVYVGGDNLAVLPERELLRLRSKRIGTVMQNPSRSLLSYGTAEDNILFAQRSLPAALRVNLPSPEDLLGELGLRHLLQERAGGLSGGEQQRLAVAVGLSNAPSLLLADEPTSQLDQRSRDDVVALLKRAAQRFAVTTIVVTHDRAVADAMNSVFEMREGRLLNRTPERVSAVVPGDGRVQLTGLSPDLFPAGASLRLRNTPRGIIVEREESAGNGTTGGHVPGRESVPGSVTEDVGGARFRADNATERPS